MLCVAMVVCYMLLFCCGDCLARVVIGDVAVVNGLLFLSYLPCRSGERVFVCV